MNSSPSNIGANFTSRLIRAARRTLLSVLRKVQNVDPHLAVLPGDRALSKLGTEYGGWNFSTDGLAADPVLVSCGLGEDASFDVEFANKFGAKVVLVDPTPRAISHFRAIESRFGQPRTQAYSQSGCQPVESYDLRRINSENFVLCDKALWNANTKLKFFSPVNPAHVSHSIVNFQRNYATDTEFIEVEAITVAQLMDTYRIQRIDVLKLDIEGAEVEVIIDLLSGGINPLQILVEYDEMMAPSKRSKRRVESAHAALLQNGYLLVHCEGTNFTYVHNSLAPPAPDGSVQ